MGNLNNGERAYLARIVHRHGKDAINNFLWDYEPRKEDIPPDVYMKRPRIYTDDAPVSVLYQLVGRRTANALRNSGLETMGQLYSRRPAHLPSLGIVSEAEIFKVAYK